MNELISLIWSKFYPKYVFQDVLSDASEPSLVVSALFPSSQTLPSFLENIF